MGASLIGSWDLEDCVYRSASRERRPYGEDPDGVLVYSADGGMAVVIARAGRPPIGGGDVRGGTIEDRAAALDSSAAYAGRWERDGDDVIHHLVTCTIPDWVGTVQRRHLRLDGDELVLATEPMHVAGEDVVAELVWRRRGAPRP